MQNDSTSDNQLIDAIASGDESALATLYDRYSAAVLQVTYRIVGDQAIAEEIVQETFYRVWDKSETYERSRGRLSTWIFRIARNLALDTLRRRRVRPQTVSDESEQRQLELQADTTANVAEGAWINIRRQVVLAALQQLPEEQKEVIQLAFFRGLSRREIASETETALGTVHTRVRLALSKLGQILGSEGING